jgi:hypothetical protein
MTKKNTLAGLILLVAGSLLIAACSAPQTPTVAPTIDANMIYTQAAQTVQAGLAQTPVPPTEAPTATVAATATMDPNIGLALTATAQSVQPPAGGATVTVKAGTPQSTTVAGAAAATATKGVAVLPTATKAVVSQPKSTGDKAELVSQDPGDGSQVTKGHEFNVHLTFKNTGTTTWNNKYALKFYAGDRMGSPNDIMMTKEVKPGETITLNFVMKGMDSQGKKRTIWVLQNPDAVNFYSLWLDTEVVD